MVKKTKMSKQAPQTRTLPTLFRTLIGHVNKSANRIGRPEKFTGIILFNAERNSEQKTYKISLRRSTALTKDQLDRVVAILNENAPVVVPDEKAKTLPIIRKQTEESTAPPAPELQNE